MGHSTLGLSFGWLLDTDRASNAVGAVDLSAPARTLRSPTSSFSPAALGAGRPDLEQAFWNGYGREVTAAEQRALRCLSALDAASVIVWAVPNADHEIVERGRATLARLEMPAA